MPENFTHKIIPYRSDVNGEYRWRLVHANGNIIAESSEGYARKGDRDAALLNVVAAIKQDTYIIDYGDEDD